MNIFTCPKAETIKGCASVSILSVRGGKTLINEFVKFSFAMAFGYHLHFALKCD